MVSFVFIFIPCSVLPLSFSKPSRQMTEERMHRAGRRKMKEGCRDGERLQQRQQHHHKLTSEFLTG
jgi:hypothetical protein